MLIQWGRRTVFAISIGCIAIGCTPVEPDRSVFEQEQRSESQALAQIFESYTSALYRLNPLLGTLQGEHRYNHLLANTFSDEYRERKLMLEEEYLAAIETIRVAKLSPDERVSFELFKYEREMTIERLQFPWHLLPLDQMYNIANQLATLGSGASEQPFRTYEDYLAWEARLKAIPPLFKQIEQNLYLGLEEDITQPRVLMVRVLQQVQAHVVEDITESLFYRPLVNFPDGFSETQQRELVERYEQLLTEHVIPAYRSLAETLETDIIPHSRSDSYGMGDLPQGMDWYRFEVRWQTTTELTPAEIHRIGLREVARIQEAILSIKEEVGFEGDLQAFFEFTRDDPQFHYDSAEEMLDDFRSVAAQADVASLHLFHADMLPKGQYEIKTVEVFREQSASSGSYRAGAEDGSQPGIFYVNTYGLSARPRWATAALTLHEAIPGHHYQVAMQREMKHLPDFRRFNYSVAFSEGWALYSESLGEEMGLYDAYDRYGQLVAELWRAIRLVVDTGIHAEGWSRHQVLEYMYANAPVQEARAVSEAERFMALPGQALSYKIGQMRIRALRTAAEETLGEQFSVKDFHREVLRHGSIPLSMLEEKVQAWLEAEAG